MLPGYSITSKHAYDVVARPHDRGGSSGAELGIRTNDADDRGSGPHPRLPTRWPIQNARCSSATRSPDRDHLVSREDARAAWFRPEDVRPLGQLAGMDATRQQRALPYDDFDAVYEQMIVRVVAPALGAALEDGTLSRAGLEVFLRESVGYPNCVVVAAVSAVLPVAGGLGLDELADRVADELDRAELLESPTDTGTTTGAGPIVGSGAVLDVVDPAGQPRPDEDLGRTNARSLPVDSRGLTRVGPPARPRLWRCPGEVEPPPGGPGIVVCTGLGAPEFDERRLYLAREVHVVVAHKLTVALGPGASARGEESTTPPPP